MSDTPNFQSVGTALSQHRPVESGDEIMTPTTPRARRLSQNEGTEHMLSENNGGTPSLSSSIPGQLPLPSSPFAPSKEYDVLEDSLRRGTSQSSIHSSAIGPDDMDVDASDDDQDGSDNDTESGEPGRSSKKKKGQRFFCTEFPPCNLSFTRSEHLARHIRKHTGERPFQCHCNRRFSRLDNLRQHAQTVHVNEEIPGDSLAATGTRFQRQIRTERVRPASGRPRTGTMGSTGSHSRGHSRNLSTSSVGSTTSNYSNPSETRRRPPPLIMANESNVRPKVGIEPPVTPPAQYRGYSASSPGGLGTPTSATYSTAPGSPGYGSSIGSPLSNTSRIGAFYDARTPSRRLSVPSSANPFQAPHANTHPSAYLSPLAPSPANLANNGSVFASSTSSNFLPSYMDPSGLPGEDWRRRTWHPSTYPAAVFNYSRPATSGLTYSQTPDAPQPAFAQHATAAAGHAPRLPGIESFDHMQHRPSTPPRRQPSPMQVDVVPQSTPFVGSNPPMRSFSNATNHRRGHVSWDMSLHSNLTRLDIQGGTPKSPTSWGQQVINDIQDAASRQLEDDPLPTGRSQAFSNFIQQQGRQPPPSASPVRIPTTQQKKRHGWYNGPLHATRTSPEDSSSSEGVPTPGMSAVEVHPAIMHSNGYIEPQHPDLSAEGHPNDCVPPPANYAQYARRTDVSQRPSYYTGPTNTTNDMGRLEALVAVATSEEKAATAAQ